MNQHLVLTGLPGSGKTTVGRAVAERLGAAFTDVDEAVELATGTSVAEVFRTMGEPRFRELERAVMDGALAAPPHVVAPGAGWIVQPGNLEAAERAGALVVYLRVTIPEAARRLGGSNTRPLLSGEEPEAALQRLLGQREEAYRSTSHVVEADRSVETVVEALSRLLAGFPGRS